MKFCHVTFLVKNLDKALCFYQDVIGLSLHRRFVAGDGLEIAFVGSGDTEIEFICNQSNEDTHIGRDITLGFEVTSLDETIALLSQKGVAFGAVVQLGPDVRCIYMSDPNGIRVQLIEYAK